MPEREQPPKEEQPKQEQPKKERPKQELPPWLKWIHEFERAIGEPVEAFVRSDEYFDMVTHANRARARFAKVFEEASEQWLHLFNIPAASDVRRLREQVSRMERELNRMTKDLADRREDALKPARRRAPATTDGSRTRSASKRPRTRPSAAEPAPPPAE